MSRMSDGRKRAVAWMVGPTVMLAALVAIAAWFWDARRPPSASHSGEAAITGDFSLVDHTGKSVTDEDFEGRWQLVFFGFTSCPDVCPTTLGTITDVMQELGGDAAEVQPLFISVDPKRDTPEALVTFLEAFDPRILGLTGAPEQIEAAAWSFRTSYEVIPEQNAPEHYTMFHQGYLFLMDPEGEFDRVFSQPATADEVVTAIRKRL